jgi:ribosomal protein S18 acetylase RimI-like enzyme
MGDERRLVLREATAADVPALAALGRDSFTATFGHLYAASDLAAFLAETHDEAAVARRLADPARVYRLAEVDGALAGYVQLVVAGGLDYPTGAARPVTLSQLYCAPAATGRGIGAALLAWALAEARARGADEMRLSVWSGNHGAQRFYARHGFVHVADIDFWVGNHRDDEFLYALKL